MKHLVETFYHKTYTIDFEQECFLQQHSWSKSITSNLIIRIIPIKIKLSYLEECKHIQNNYIIYPICNSFLIYNIKDVIRYIHKEGYNLSIYKGLKDNLQNDLEWFRERLKKHIVRGVGL